MPMKINFTDCHIIDCGTGIEVTHGSDVEMTGSMRIINCEKAIVERDPPNVLEALGLPPNTPPAYVKKVLLALQEVPAADAVSKEKVIKKTQLWSFVQNSSNAVTVLQALISIGPAVIAGLLGMFK
ncbi:hypothetical protein [Pseudomonas sp. Irchel 3E19]|uniref:hypothetical protein n=1 Tax=Pseudomonas sp. Irchel 3E19 TaxID=2008981 RepID=UPI000BA3C660|nr:hypothetical protein [Pseudomonas sp. Irchel 3E19]